MARIEKLKRDGFTGYRMLGRGKFKKVQVRGDTIKIERRKMKNGRTAVIAIGNVDGNRIPRIVGQE